MIVARLRPAPAARARTRVLAVVAVAALAAVAAVVGVTLLQTRGETTTAPGAVTAPRKGYPVLQLDFGVRTDPEATALTRAAALYNEGHRAEAAAIFARYQSLPAQIGAAFASWPGHALDDLKRLVAANPRSALAELHLGWAFYWSGRNADAVTAWKRAEAVQPDTPFALDAESVLYAAHDYLGRPPVVLPYGAPADIARLAPAQELAALARDAAAPDARAKLLYGVALQHLGRSLSAERQFAAAAKLAPHDPVAQVAAAVGRFTKANPRRAFAVLGPLTAVFPHAPVVRFHLGLLLLWTLQKKLGAEQMRLTVAENPKSTYAKQATSFLADLVKNGTR